jgi:hypothetical protein
MHGVVHAKSGDSAIAEDVFVLPFERATLRLQFAMLNLHEQCSPCIG